MTPVVLVLCPPQNPFVGSMALAQLKAQAIAHGHRCRVIYANLLYARRIGTILCGYGARQVMMGELPFALALFGGRKGAPDDGRIRTICRTYLEELRPFAPDRRPEDIVWNLAEHARATAEETAKRILEERPAVVGFSCTHRQLAASLLVARMVKRKCPDIITIFGGNGDLFGPMGTEALRQFEQIDFVARGDSEISFIRWLDFAMEGRAEEPVPGIQSRRHTDDGNAPMLSNEEFENLPFADHTDFLEEFAALLPSHALENAMIPFEMNRGCWWSMTSKRCLFCAENLADRRTRVRSAARVKAEIEAMLAKRKKISLLCTDTALRKDRYRDFLPWVANRREIKRLFVETMASLDEEQVSSLAKARVFRFQPGIENLSDNSLRHLSKPTSARHNIALLKYCREYDIYPSWNYLMQIPFLEPSDLAEQCRRMRLLEHLVPPRTNPVKIQRTSRLYARLSEMQDMPLEPEPIMQLCYPLEKSSLMNLSLTFHCPSLESLLKTREKEEHDGQLRNCLANWRKNFLTSYLVMAVKPRDLVVLDTRACRTRIRHVLRGVRKDVYELCISWKTKASVRRALESVYPSREIDNAVDELLAEHLLLEIDGQLLALATRMPLGMRAAPPAVEGLASLASHRLRDFLAAGKILGAGWTSLPQRLGYFAVGKLLSLREKILSHIAWRAVRLLSRF